MSIPEYRMKKNNSEELLSVVFQNAVKPNKYLDSLRTDFSNDDYFNIHLNTEKKVFCNVVQSRFKVIFGGDFMMVTDFIYT